MFTAIFLTLIVLGWLILGFIPWLAWSVATRGHAGLGMLPLCLLAAVVGGLAVPLLLRDDEWGLLWSATASATGSLVLLAARRLAVPFAESPEPAAPAADLRPDA